jgi:hypothetical protein
MIASREVAYFEELCARTKVVREYLEARGEAKSTQRLRGH